MFYLTKTNLIGGYLLSSGATGADGHTSKSLGHSLLDGTPQSSVNTERLVQFFPQIHPDQFRQVGGQAVWLADLARHLAPLGVNIPHGFVVTADACLAHFQQCGLEERFALLGSGSGDDADSRLETRLRDIRRLILETPLPRRVLDAIAYAYGELSQRIGFGPKMAVRSDVIAEKLMLPSIGGAEHSIYASHLAQLTDAVRQALADAYTLERWRRRGSGDRSVYLHAVQMERLSVTVMQCADSRRLVSGMLLTEEPESGFSDALVVNAHYGLAEPLVDGRIDPDEFRVYKPTLGTAIAPILKRRRGDKALKSIHTEDGRGGVCPILIEVSPDERKHFTLTDDSLLTLARIAVAIECHVQGRVGKRIASEIDWQQDGVTGQILITRVQPKLGLKEPGLEIPARLEFLDSGWELAKGTPVGNGVVVGPARIVRSVRDLPRVRPGDIVVSECLEADWAHAVRGAGAIVTNRGGRFCRAAQLARGWGIPALVGCKGATLSVADGDPVTIAAFNGDVGYVYDKALTFRRTELSSSELGETQTEIMLNLADPACAFEQSKWSVAGVGMVRLEFIIDHLIRVHPRLLLEYEGLEAEMQFTVDQIVQGYPSRKEYFVQRLAEAIGTIAAAFHPRPVTVRFSDFKSNEYSALYGGDHVERHEGNPLVGMRGARRYISKEFVSCFAMECEAIRQVRERMGLRNVHVVVPFVRTVTEARKVLNVMQQAGLRRNDNEFRINMMCETPANALLADEFLPYFDGITIGTSDLTQLALGVDRESDLFRDYDERNRAVLKLMLMAIEAAQRHGKPVSVSGCAAAAYPEIVRWFVERRVDSISVEPERYFDVRRIVSDTEEQVYGPKTEQMAPYLKSTA